MLKFTPKERVNVVGHLDARQVLHYKVFLVGFYRENGKENGNKYLGTRLRVSQRSAFETRSAITFTCGEDLALDHELFKDIRDRSVETVAQRSQEFRVRDGLRSMMSAPSFQIPLTLLTLN